MSFRTFTPKAQSSSEKKWYILNAEGKTLGHLATKIADILRGKNKATFTPHLDMGDNVVVINVEKIRLSGRKTEQKEYIHHTGWWGHLRREPFKRVLERSPKRILEQAVAGMIPRNRLKRPILAKLHLYAGAEHPHAGQKPLTLEL